MYDEVHIANYQKKELHKHNYTIIKDPTGTSPFKLIENFLVLEKVIVEQQVTSTKQTELR